MWGSFFSLFFGLIRNEIVPLVTHFLTSLQVDLLDWEEWCFSEIGISWLYTILFLEFSISWNSNSYRLFRIFVSVIGLLIRYWVFILGVLPIWILHFTYVYGGFVWDCINVKCESDGGKRSACVYLGSVKGGFFKFQCL